MRIGELNVWVLAEMGMAEIAQRGPRQSQEKMACDKSRRTPLFKEENRVNRGRIPGENGLM